MKDFAFAIQKINQEYRHLVGGYAIGLSELEINIGKIINHAKWLLNSKGKTILAIPYQEAYENSFAYLLKLLTGKLLIEGNRRTSLLFPQTNLDISKKMVGNNQQNPFSEEEFLIIHNLPSHRNLVSLLETESKNGQIIIATGIDRQWESFTSEIPIIFYSEEVNYRQGFYLESIEQEFDKIIETDLKAFQNLSDWQKEAFLIVSSFDFLGIPLPFDLLASSLKVSEEELGTFIENETSTLLYWTETDFPPTLLVTTKSPLIAERLLQKIASMSTGKLFKNYTQIIGSVEAANKDERYTILNLFQTAALGFSSGQNETFLSRPGLQNLIDECLEKLREIWASGDAIERLLWGKVLEDLLRFELSAEVFTEGLKTNANNSYLLQAQARMFGHWALVEPEKMEKAEQLFGELADATAENPYFLQARGVFEASRNNPPEARNYFKDALKAAQGEEGKAYVLTAWANLEIDEGNYATAEKRLSEIARDSKSPYLPHIWAKLGFYRGDYEKATEKIKELFALRPYSIEGWNLIGEIASKRGHWQKAKTALSKVLQISPENVPTLRSRGDLETDLGKIAVDKNNLEEAQKHFAKAGEYFAKALEAEPKNFIAEVSHNVLLRYEGSLLKKQNQNEKAERLFDQSEKSLKGLLEKFKRNEFITHNLGELYQAKGLFDLAKHYFEALCKQNKNLPNLMGLAKAELSLGNTEEVKRILQEAEQTLELSTQKIHDKIRSFNSLAEVWITLEDFEKAEFFAQKAFELDQENGFTLRLFAKIRRLSGKEKEADLFEKKAEYLANQELEEFLTEKK